MKQNDPGCTCACVCARACAFARVCMRVCVRARSLGVGRHLVEDAALRLELVGPRPPPGHRHAIPPRTRRPQRRDPRLRRRYDALRYQGATLARAADVLGKAVVAVDALERDAASGCCNRLGELGDGAYPCRVRRQAASSLPRIDFDEEVDCHACLRPVSWSAEQNKHIFPPLLEAAAAMALTFSTLSTRTCAIL